MISGKIVKALCWTLMILFDAIAVGLLIAGIYLMSESHSLGMILFGSGIILPLIIGVILYPVVALASIDENIKEMSKKYDLMLCVLRKTKNNCDDNKGSTHHELVDESEVSFNRHLDLIEYINGKYAIDITVNDSIQDVKNKIDSIEEKNTSIQIFKQQIRDLSTKESIILAMQIHKTING